MSDLSNINPMPDEEQHAGEPETQSPWTMAFTMVLMIAGLLFASLLMMKQALDRRTTDGKPVLQLSKLIDAGQSFMTRPAPPETAAAKGQQKHPSKLESIKEIVTFHAGDKVWWPRLKMTGFGKSTDGSEGFAIINGNQVHPGEYIGKVKLLEVRSHDVIVEYKGEQKTLTVDSGE